MKTTWQCSGLPLLILLSLFVNKAQATEDLSLSQINELPEVPNASANKIKPSAPADPPPAPTFTKPTLDLDQKSAQPMRKLTSVAELSDVKPNDWAYESLRSLVERHAAIAGYPDGTFRGNRHLTRHEFAAALAAAIPIVHFSGFATQKDLEDLQQMQTDFAEELAIVKGKVSRLESVLKPVSETTWFTGEAIVAPIFVGKAERSNSDAQSTDSELAVGSRVKLNFITNLGGKTQLRTTLKANNIPAVQQATGTDMARLSFQGDSDNRLELDELSLRSRFNKRVTLFAFAAGAGLNKFTDTLNPFLSSSGEGSISRFGQRNPIYRQGGDVGLGFSFQLSQAVNLDIGYLADKGINDPAIGVGNVAYGAIAQLTVEFNKTTALGLTYIRSFNRLDTNTGSDRANDPFANTSRAMVTNSFGLQTTIGLSKNLALSGWLGFSHATAKDLPGDPAASILNWAVTVAIPNLGREGSLLGFVVGQSPKVIANEFQPEGKSYEDAATSLHLEGFYRIPLSKGISLTPGFLIITRPNHRPESESIFIGTLRTTFSF